MDNKVTQKLRQANPVTVLLVVFIFAVVVLLFISPVLRKVFAPGADPQAVEIPELEMKNFTGTDAVTFGLGTLKLPANWHLSAYLQSTSNTDLVCASPDGCEVAIISNDNVGANLPEAVLSTPNSVRRPTFLESSASNLTVTFLGKTVVLQGEEYIFLEDTESKIYRQLYGCSSDGLCVLAGILDPVAEVNASQVSEFIQFLSNISL